MLEYNSFKVFSYIELQCFCLIILIYLFNAVNKYNEGKNAKTSKLLVVLFISCMGIIISDVCWAIVEYATVSSNWASYLANIIYFIFSALASYLWFVFQEKQSNSKLAKHNVLLLILAVPCLINIALTITAPSNHLVFLIDSAGSYERGSFHLYYSICNLAYLIASCFRSIYRVKTSKETFEKDLNRTLMYYPIPIVLSGVIQIVAGYAFNCIGFTVSFYILYENFVREYEKKQLETENNLVADYDAIFLVNSKLDTVHVLRMCDDYRQNNLGAECLSGYKARIQESIVKNIVEECRKQAEIEFAAKHVIERLKTEKTYYFDYCAKNALEEYVHYRAKFERAKNLPDEAFLLGIKNVEETYKAQLELEKRRKEEEKMLLVIKNIANDYEYIEYTKINEEKSNDEVTVYRCSDFLKNMVPDLEYETNITKRYELILDNLIDEKEKDYFYHATRRETILEALKKNPAHFIYFNVNKDNSKHHYQIKYAVADQDEEGNIKATVLGIKNIDNEVETKEELSELEKAYAKQEAFVKLFVDSYASAYYIDLANDKYTIYKKEGVEDRFLTGNYYETMSKYVDTYVLKEDRKMMFEMTSIPYMKKTLSNRKDYYAVFTDISHDNVFYKMTVIRGADDTHAAMAFSNVNDEYLKEQAIQQELEDQVKVRTKKITNMNIGIMELLGDVVESRDKDSGKHVHRVKSLTEALALQIMRDYPEFGLDESMVEKITMASMLHDVGKISIPDAILLKPGKLTDKEFEIMKTHCYAGYELLKKLEKYWDEEYLEYGYDICRYHHERYDGSGYPCGLKGDDIPIAAQIVSVADCFDALTSKRTYKDAYDPETAFTMIITGECGIFSDKLICSLIRCKETFIKIRLNGNYN